MKISGQSIIGLRSAVNLGPSFRAANPRTGERLPPDFFSAGVGEVNLAAGLAHEAFAIYGQLSGREKGKFLRTIAAKIEGAVDELVERAEQETALPKPRLQSETGRTSGQLRLFAQLVEEGSWVTARIDRADASSKPPKPDLRSMLHALGPVVVFGASNFPLAFSVAGGDTASALAAGNPVVMKAHAAHPGTSELVGRAVVGAVRACSLPEGTFSLLFDAGTRAGAALVQHLAIKACAFTGSRAGGVALLKLANSRSAPIPFYAEMSSTNPVFVLSGALHDRTDRIAAGLHASVTLGAGQFCTKPGVAFLEENGDARKFAAKLGELFGHTPGAVLLTSAIHTFYDSGVAARSQSAAIIAQGQSPPQDGYRASAALFEAEGASFLANPELAEELFGPATVLIRCSGRNQLLDIARRLEGHLTATIHATDEDLRDYADLIAILETKVGRLVVNGFPTGVEVGPAMVHGGPFPATSDSRASSVGTRAILRFVRPVCFQNFPDRLLPDELKDGNPLGIWREMNGQISREAVQRG